ncbi:MAG: type II toxin-antitoxin system RelE/ParE family toxin [Clostridia bacterium]|nr:type II toxin-antitoxin system RelE/ParE family toxin [Clostridia bacterium]MBR4443298.1 type II toxin-antitoxin system RelE/ParE family toxin [Clostridia bacterium]
MKSYHVDYAKKVIRELQKLDPSTARLIYSWIGKNLEGCDNPRAHGKALSANLAGLWRYRVGNFRLIAEIQDDRLVILMIEIGHRSEIYN